MSYCCITCVNCVSWPFNTCIEKNTFLTCTYFCNATEYNQCLYVVVILASGSFIFDRLQNWKYLRIRFGNESIFNVVKSTPDANSHLNKWESFRREASKNIGPKPLLFTTAKVHEKLIKSSLVTDLWAKEIELFEGDERGPYWGLGATFMYKIGFTYRRKMIYLGLFLSVMSIHFLNRSPLDKSYMVLG